MGIENAFFDLVSNLEILFVYKFIFWLSRKFVGY